MKHYTSAATRMELVRFPMTNDDWTPGSAAPNRAPPRYLSLISLGVG